MNRIGEGAHFFFFRIKTLHWGATCGVCQVRFHTPPLRMGRVSRIIAVTNLMSVANPDLRTRKERCERKLIF